MRLFRRNTLSEAEIIEKAKHSKEYFGMLYNTYHHRIFCFIFKRIEDEQSAADVTSQVFIKAFLNIKKFEYKGYSISSWFFRIAINECNAFFRKKAKVRIISIDDAGIKALNDQSEVQEENPLSPDDLAIGLSALSEEDLNLIELRYFEKLSFKEIAEILGITENNAKVRAYRILGKLKKNIESK